MPSSGALSARGRVAGLTRSRTASDPELIEARRSLKAASIEAYIRRKVEEAPPLTPEQRNHLARILGGDAA